MRSYQSLASQHVSWRELLAIPVKQTTICDYNKLTAIKQFTVNGERFTGLNLRVCYDFQEYRESFPMNICTSFI